MDSPWRIELLGGLRATRGGEEVRRFRRQKVGVLLAYLAATCCADGRSQRVHPRDALIDLLWPDCDPEAGRNRLSVALSSLRRQLEPPGVPPGSVILADHATVRLNPVAVVCDVAQFESALQAAERASSSLERVERLAEAVSLYGGEFLPGCFDEWVLPERERHREAYLQALIRLATLSEEDAGAALRWARQAVAADPLREEAHRELIRLFCAAGETEAARRQYRELERLLAEHLGDAPSPETRSLLAVLPAPGSGLRDLGKDEPQLSRGAASRRLSPRARTTAARRCPPEPGASLPAGTVTFLLTDIEGSTALWEKTGDAFKEALARHHALLRRCFGEHDGHVVKEMGDGFLVAFSRAGDALAGAVAGQEALAAPDGEGGEGGWPGAVGAPRVRMALHTADVSPEGDDYRTLALHHAQRILVAGHGGQILCSDATATLLRRDLPAGVQLADLGVYRLRGLESPERLFQVEPPGTPPRVFPRLRAQPGYPVSLPLQLTRFFGRDEELELLGKLLREPSRRLLTLMGPGGSGKTRLAAEAARQLAEEGHGAVWFVPLADLADPRRLSEAIRDAMRLPREARAEPLEQVVAALEGQPALLVLDNFEHLVAEGTPLVWALLERAPRLTCLVTSRQRLGLEGEREFLVPPLPVPDRAAPGSDRLHPEPGPPLPRRNGHRRRLCAEEGLRGGAPQSPERLIAFPSIRLFVDRAQAVRPDFQVTEANAAVLAELCVRLEGLPLALELAAARVGVMTPGQMLERLAARFDLLARTGRPANARHASLRAALDWSYQLLAPDLQQFFRSLSVFRGSFLLEAAEAVSQSAAALDALSELRECSLLQTEERHAGGEVRFRLLETVREYAAEQASPEQRAEYARRHAAFYLELAEQAEAGLSTPEQEVSLDRLEVEHDNLRSALAWSTDSGDAETGLALAGALARFWAVRGHLAEGRERLAALLALPGVLAFAPVRAKAVNGAGTLAWHQGDYAAAWAHYEQGLDLRRAIGDRKGCAASLNNLGNVALARGEYERARSLYEEGLAIQRDLGEPQNTARFLNNLGNVAHYQSDYAAARALYEECLRLRREMGDHRDVAFALQNLGNVALEQGEDAAARALYEESLELRRRLNDRRGISISLLNVGLAAANQGERETARALFEEGLTISRELGDRSGIAEAIYNLARIEAPPGATTGRADGERARARYEECLAIWRDLEDRRGVAYALAGLARLALDCEDAASAHSLYGESFELRRALGDRHGIAVCLEGLAAVLARQGRSESAARLYGTAESLRERLGARRSPAEGDSYAQEVAQVRASLGEDLLAALWAEGRELTPEEAFRAGGSP
jgi:predicted ATPase/DNA-binding SARP family transcriptional activator/class 3 adenylate cyclase